jgi:fatty-acid desaturase
MGMRWWELDAGWVAVLALEALGLVRNVRAWSRGNAPAKPGAAARG